MFHTETIKQWPQNKGMFWNGPGKEAFDPLTQMVIARSWMNWRIKLYYLWNRLRYAGWSGIVLVTWTVQGGWVTSDIMMPCTFELISDDWCLHEFIQQLHSIFIKIQRRRVVDTYIDAYKCTRSVLPYWLIVMHLFCIKFPFLYLKAWIYNKNNPGKGKSRTKLPPVFKRKKSRYHKRMALEMKGKGEVDDFVNMWCMKWKFFLVYYNRLLFDCITLIFTAG